MGPHSHQQRLVLNTEVTVLKITRLNSLNLYREFPLHSQAGSSNPPPAVPESPFEGNTINPTRYDGVRVDHSVVDIGGSN